MNKFKILTIFGNFLKNFGALNKKQGFQRIFVLVRTTHSPNIKALAKKLKEEIDFNRLTYFRPMFGGPQRPNGGPKPKNSNGYVIRVPKTMCNQNLKVLASIMKKFKILTILGPPRAFLGGPKSKIGLLEDFCIGQDYSF